ncbi:MAG: hypothetical protein IPJ20_07550 [Flammeovirgaceae bacterium]|nr:hypothetical protein [Flammeovirgaceae bacterium]
MKVLILFFISLQTFVGIAQDVRSGSHVTRTERLKGYFVNIENDTTTVIFEIPFFRNAIDYERIQGTWVYRLKYFDSLGHKQILSLWHTRFFGFQLPGEFKNEFITMVALTDWNRQKKHSETGTFMKLLVDGRLKCFIQYNDEVIGATGIRVGQMMKAIFYQKGDSEIVRVNLTNFKKQMSEYLAENPILVQKINSDVYSAKDYEQIARDYNASALN